MSMRPQADLPVSLLKHNILSSLSTKMSKGEITSILKAKELIKIPDYRKLTCMKSRKLSKFSEKNRKNATYFQIRQSAITKD
jgi:hypothetical protein